MIRGIRMTDLQAKVDKGTKIYGRPIAEIKEGELVAGANLTRALNVTMGDKISLVSAAGATPTPFGTMPRIMAYPVMSSFFMGMYEYDSGYIFMPLETSQKYLNIGNAVTHIDLFLDDPEDTRAVADALARLLPDGFVVRDWRDLNRGFVGALQVESNVMFLILMKSNLSFVWFLLLTIFDLFPLSEVINIFFFYLSLHKFFLLNYP